MFEVLGIFLFEGGTVIVMFFPPPESQTIVHFSQPATLHSISTWLRIHEHGYERMVANLFIWFELLSEELPVRPKTSLLPQVHQHAS